MEVTGAKQSFTALPVQEDAAFPSGGLVADETGNLYGVTLLGGANNLGAVYQLSPPTTEGGSWTETVIFSLSGPDGTLPSGRLNLIKVVPFTEPQTAEALCRRHVFELTPPSGLGASWSQSVLFNFSGGSRDWGNPVAGVIFNNNGRLRNRLHRGWRRSSLLGRSHISA